jgi:hypothetical protein
MLNENDQLALMDLRTRLNEFLLGLRQFARSASHPKLSLALSVLCTAMEAAFHSFLAETQRFQED